MPTEETMEWGPADDLGSMIAAAPYATPDPALAKRIVRNLAPRRPGWFTWMWQAVCRPMTVSFSPLAASMTAVCLLVAGGLLSSLVPGHQPGPVGLQPPGGSVPVMFRLQAPQAQSVSVIGSFNQWNPQDAQMVQDPVTGEWRLHMELSPGRYDYVFLVDGQQVTPDPRADLSREDDYGHRNSILFLRGDHGNEI